MVQLSSVISSFRKTPEGEPADIVGALAGIGSIFGVIAAAIGLLAGISLVPLTAITWEVLSADPFRWIVGGTSMYPVLTAAFMGVMAIGLFLQAFGSQDVRARLGTSFGSVLYIGFIVAIFIAGYAVIGFGIPLFEVQAASYLQIMYLFGAIFAIAWQMVSVFYIDSSKTWTGFIAGILNGMFLPALAIGQAFGPIFIYAAYALLLLGQLTAAYFWWSPRATIREFSRSPEKAKFAFGLSGFLAFIIGLAPVLYGPLQGTSLLSSIWRPWSTTAPYNTSAHASPIAYVTNPALVYGFVAAMTFWIMLSPRLGARELKTAAIGEDIIKGGSKWFAIFLLFIGLLALGQGGTFAEGISSWGFFIIIAPAGAMILIGTLYTAKTDIVTGFPLIVAGVLLMVSPYSLAALIIGIWILVIITQAFIAVECHIRGLTGFSQGALTVIVSIASSIAIIIFMLGGLGSGPLALWPTNRWFNINLIPGLSADIQMPLVITIPFLMLLIRNSALVGYSHGRGYSTGGILMGATTLFAFMIPVIAGNVTVTHSANTGAALMLALYSISVILIMSLNLSLANDVESTGHDFEGTLIKVSTISQVLVAAAVAIMVLVYFSGLPTPVDIALVISVFVTFVVSTEILSIIGWFVAGIRLGLLKEGFRYRRLSE
jgi:hypothetical protein